MSANTLTIVIYKKWHFFLYKNVIYAYHMIMCFEDYIQSTNQKHVKTHPGYNSRLKLQSISTANWNGHWNWKHQTVVVFVGGQKMAP